MMVNYGTAGRIVKKTPFEQINVSHFLFFCLRTEKLMMTERNVSFYLQSVHFSYHLNIGYSFLSQQCYYSETVKPRHENLFSLTDSHITKVLQY
jgi:hypothetical protein